MSLSNKDFIPVSELQHYLLKAMQEANELSHAISKILEFGIDSEDPITHIKNIDAVNKEYNDIRGVMMQLQALGFPVTEDDGLVGAKIDKMAHFIEKSREIGMVAKKCLVTKLRCEVPQTKMSAMVKGYTLILGTSAPLEKLVEYAVTNPDTFSELSGILIYIKDWFKKANIVHSIEVEIDEFIDSGRDIVELNVKVREIDYSPDRFIDEILVEYGGPLNTHVTVHFGMFNE